MQQTKSKALINSVPRLFSGRITALVFILISGAAQAKLLPTLPPADFTQCKQFFAGGKVPVFQARSPAKARPLCYDAFAVLHSGTTRTPLYVAERINKSTLQDAAGEKRSNRFFADARLPASERAALDDYKGSGYARGHMAPAANMANPEAMAQSFSLANMVPQAPRNNSGPWAGIEKATRKYAMRASGDVYVITGPVFDESAEVIGPNRVRVPRYLFKLVYDPVAQRAWAHWLENTEQARIGRPIEYAELVRRTGIEFLPGLTIR
ncbi:endonuclease G [Massilia sp. CF038]|nr:endonuclease G [Massilia sp. CF038]